MRHKKNLNKLLSNPNNSIANMDDVEETIKLIDVINRTNKHDLVGYIVFNNCKVSSDIRTCLGIDSDVVLIMSKGKIKTKMDDIKIDSATIYRAIEKSLVYPDVIVFDKQRNSYQFYVSLPKGEHRLVIQFDAIPLGIKDAKQIL